MSEDSRTCIDDPERGVYLAQNRAIHQARAQLCMDLDDCRELAREINGEGSISSLSLRERWELIEILKSKGARVYNPRLPESLMFPGNNCASSWQRGDQPAPIQAGCSLEREENLEDVYRNRLAYWRNRFQRRRAGFASNEQLALIEHLWERFFEDGRPGRGLRGFLVRQCGVDDLAFLMARDVKKIITALKATRKKKIEGGRKE